MNTEQAKKRLEYLRGCLRAESISYGELHELVSLHIEPGDVELLEPAGVPEEQAYLSKAQRARLQAKVKAVFGKEAA